MSASNYVDGALYSVWDDETRTVTYYENGEQTEQRPYNDEENAAADWRVADQAAQAQAQEDALNREALYQAQLATQAPPASGEEWVQPTDVHNSYAIDSTVSHNGKDWVSLTPFNVWEPGVSGWREVVASGYPAWVQPTGGHDAYNVGDRVTHNAQNWESNTPNNVWEPGVYGWVTIA